MKNNSRELTMLKPILKVGKRHNDRRNIFTNVLRNHMYLSDFNQMGHKSNYMT